MTAMSQPQVIAITPGDPCGIGPEIVARAFLKDAPVTHHCFVAGDLALMQKAARLVRPRRPSTQSCAD
jgi:4-hydroxythreonine-4-phosphate dehydrogenase